MSDYYSFNPALIPLWIILAILPPLLRIISVAFDFRIQIRRAAGFFLMMYFLMSGFLLNLPLPPPDIPDISYGLTLVSDPVKKGKNWRMFAENKWGVKILLKCPQIPENLKTGSVISTEGVPVLIPEPMNPYEFNRAAWYRRSDTYYELRSKEIRILDFASSIHTYIAEFRNNIIHRIKYLTNDRREAGVAEALLLGIKDDLDETVSDAYSKSGTLHVLAVSGLHVALIFAILGKLLHGLYSVRYGSIPALAIQIGATWFYAVLSGFSPSIIRAAVMLSLISVGKNMKRRPSSGNMLLSSAFFILLASPDSLGDLGFQLSYLAVTGIIYFSESIENLISFKHKIPTLLWESASVTLAAQIFTTPLILYHFGRFPVYFLFANLIIVPWSSLILYTGGIFICLTDIIHILPFMRYLFSTLIYYLNECTLYLSNLPNAELRNLYISSEMMVLIYAVFFLWLFPPAARRYFKIPLLIICCALCLIPIDTRESEKFIFYSLKSGNLFEYTSGTNSFVFASGLRNNFSSDVSYLMKNRKQNPEHCSLIRGQLYSLENYSLLIWDELLNKHPPDTTIKTSAVLIVSKGKILIEKILKHTNAEIYIIPAAFSKKKADYLCKHLKNKGRNVFNSGRQGAFTFEFSPRF